MVTRWRWCRIGRRNDGTTERRNVPPFPRTVVPPFRRSLVPTFFLLAAPLAAQDSLAVRAHADSVSIRFVDADLRAVVQALGRFMPKPLMVAGLPATRVSLETPAPVARAAVLPLLRGLVESQNLSFEEDSAFIRIGPADRPPVRPSAHSSDSSQVQLFVLRLKHARAADVAATVNLLFGASGEFSGQGGMSRGTLSEELNRSALPSARLSDRPSDRPNPDPATRPSALSGPVTLVPDELTNALLVRATERDVAVIKDAVSQLDVRPLQVLIEILIVEARRDRNFSLGTSLFVPPQGALGGTVSGSTKSVGLGDLVIRLMDLGKAEIDATLSASETSGNVRIVSRPVLLASNNTEARLLVGSQRPFIQVSRSLPTDAPSRDQVVQYRDVGTRLTVRPTINQDGYVSLAVQQEINAATAEVAFDAPVISTREAVTQVLVRDGQTIVLGGMRDEQRERSSTGIPVLSSLPIIGGLFGTTGQRASNTELYLFLTPRILQTDADADAVTAPRLARDRVEVP